MVAHPTNPSGGTPSRVTVPYLRERKVSAGAQPIVAITAYDVTFARLFDAAGVDLILVGDSVASVVQGHHTTLPVTLDEMVYHSRCVVRGVSRALVVGDLPFMSYQVSTEQALQSAGRLIKEGGVAAVKLEGGVAVAETIARLVEVDIPVVGHVGLTPQSYHRMGGHKLQGKQHGSRNQAGSVDRIVADAQAVAEAGAFLVVIEGVPSEVAQEITQTLSVPTIGIGAGPHCDGQILVGPDLLGLNPEFKPRFVKRYAELGQLAEAAVREFAKEVRGRVFPGPEHSVSSGEVSERQAPVIEKSAPRPAKVSRLKMVRR